MSKKIKARLVVYPLTGTIDRVTATGIVRSGVGAPTGGGYLRVKLGSHSYANHRLVYEWVHGPIPASMAVDHINGIKTDNRIENLRLVTLSQNQQNRHTAATNSKTGVKGVCWNKARGKYVAAIQVNNIVRHLGLFDNVNDAALAYQQAATETHTHNPMGVRP